MDGVPLDVRSLWCEMKSHKKDLRRKRLWLMGFPEPEGSSRKRLKSSNKESILPETMLREDDLFYECLKKHVENGFGVCHEATELPTTHDVQPFVQHKMQKTILALLDDFTNNGLYLLAKVIAGSSAVLEKTRQEMKNFIKENMPKVLEKQDSSGKEGAAYKLSQILNVPHNFRKNHVMILTPIGNSTICPTVRSHNDATMFVLNGLKDMSLQTLCAMYRRLKGVKGSLPVLNPSRSGWTKGRLVSRVKSLTQKMLCKLDSLDELPEPVIKAMEVACLSLKLSDHQNASVPNFCSYRPEIVSLQNEIVKAINLLNSKVGVQELKGLKELLSPGSECEVLNGGLRKAIQRLLTEFLFECSDMDEIPIVLLDTLSVINRYAMQQKEATEEVESILNVSAHIKQIFWDFWADDELDLDFTNAYMEDLEESDGGELSDDYDKEEQLVKNNFDDISEVGSTADLHGVDSSHVQCTPTWNVSSRSVAKSESVCKTEIKVEPDDLLFTPSVVVSKSFNHTATVDSKLYQAELSKHMPGTKDSVPCFTLSATPNDQIQGKRHFQSSCQVGSANIGEDCASNIPGGKISENPSTCRNKYIAIQQASDETSLFAYRLIGHVMEGYARSEEIDLDRNQLSYLNASHLFPVDPQGTAPNAYQAMSTEDVDGSLLIQAVRELIPSFPLSELEKVSKILR